METDTIYGHHSIVAALTQRNLKENNTKAILHCTQVGFDQLRPNIPKDILATVETIKYKDAHDFYQWSATYWQQHKWTWKKITSQAVLILPAKIIQTPDALWQNIYENDKITRILILDGVTDTHNAGALFRTAAFYDVSYVITAAKGNFGLTPGLFHCASGGIEHLEIVKTPSLPSLIQKLVQHQVLCVGLTQHAPSVQEEPLPSVNDKDATFKGVALVLGEEQNGISHANLRVIPHLRSLRNRSGFHGLNVSVAGAIAMETIF